MTTHAFITAQIIFQGIPPKELSGNGRRRLASWEPECQLSRAVKEAFGWQAKDKWYGDPLEGDISVAWVVVWPKGSRRGKGDLDNLVPLLKAVQDSCNDVVWKDDSQIKSARYEQRKDDTGTWPDGCIILQVSPYEEEPLEIAEGEERR